MSCIYLSIYNSSNVLKFDNIISGIQEWMVSLGFAHQKTTTTIKSSKDLAPKGESDQSKEDAKRIAATAIAAAKAASDASKIGKIEVNDG